MNYYMEQLQWLTEIVQCLNEFDKRTNYDNYLNPQLGDIPVVLDNVVIGHLVDEIGAVWSFKPVES